MLIFSKKINWRKRQFSYTNKPITKYEKLLNNYKSGDVMRSKVPLVASSDKFFNILSLNTFLFSSDNFS